MKKKFISLLSVMMVLVMLSLSTVTVFAATSTASRNISLYKGKRDYVIIYPKQNTNITINYDLGCDSVSGAICFKITKKPSGSKYYEAVYVKSVDANTNGTLTFKVDENTSYCVSAINRNEKETLVIGTYEVTYTPNAHSGGGGSF